MGFWSADYFNPGEIFNASAILSIEQRLINAKETTFALVRWIGSATAAGIRPMR